MDDTDYLSGPIRTSEEAWGKIHGELRTAGIKYRDASEGVQKLRERAEHGSDLYDIIARTRSALEDEAGVAFQSAIADEVRTLANERDEQVALNYQLHGHCAELEEQLTQQAGREGRLIEHSGEQAQSCYFLRKHVHELESSLSAEKETVDDLQWKLDEERSARKMERDTGAKIAAERDRFCTEKGELRIEMEDLKEANAHLSDMIDNLSGQLEDERASHNATKGRQNYLEAAVTGRDDIIREKDGEIDRLTDALREAESKASLRRTLIDIVQDSRDKLRDELNEVREEAAAEGMSRRQAENTLAEIQDEVNGCPPSDARVEAVLDRHYGRHDGPAPDSGFSTIPPLLGSPSLAKGHHVRVVSTKLGVGHKGELGVVCQVHDDEGQTFPFRVRFEGGDWREYKRDELERV